MSSDPATPNSRRTVRVGKYEVVQHIATGGMGAVYKATDTDLDRVVALKVLPPETAANEALFARFRQEAKHAAKLSHENIVTIFECSEASGTWFLAMEFVDGVDLHDHVARKGRLDPEEAREIITQAARALDHAHKFGIVHRDIKPSNFLLTRTDDGRLLVKLTDFGLARKTNDDEFRVTKAGTTVGTVDYMAPEQARDSRSADIRSDLYALGCTLHQMLTGQPPFPEGSLTERLYKHIEEEPPDPRKINPRIPPVLITVWRKLLAKKPEDRYQTPGELLKALARPGTDAAEKDAPSERRPAEDRRDGRKKAAVAAPTVVRRRESESDDSAPAIPSPPPPPPVKRRDTPPPEPPPERPKPKPKPNFRRRPERERESWGLVWLGGILFVLALGGFAGVLIWRNRQAFPVEEPEPPPRRVTPAKTEKPPETPKAAPTKTEKGPDPAKGAPTKTEKGPDPAKGAPTKTEKAPDAPKGPDGARKEGGG